MFHVKQAPARRSIAAGSKTILPDFRRPVSTPSARAPLRPLPILLELCRPNCSKPGAVGVFSKGENADVRIDRLRRRRLGMKSRRCQVEPCPARALSSFGGARVHRRRLDWPLGSVYAQRSISRHARSCDREPERRRRQDDDGDQSRHRARRDRRKRFSSSTSTRRETHRPASESTATRAASRPMTCCWAKSRLPP